MNRYSFEYYLERRLAANRRRLFEMDEQPPQQGQKKKGMPWWAKAGLGAAGVIAGGIAGNWASDQVKDRGLIPGWNNNPPAKVAPAEPGRASAQQGGGMQQQQQGGGAEWVHPRLGSKVKATPNGDGTYKVIGDDNTFPDREQALQGLTQQLGKRNYKVIGSPKQVQGGTGYQLNVMFESFRHRRRGPRF